MVSRLVMVMVVVGVGLALVFVASSASAQHPVEVHNPGMFDFGGQGLEIWAHNAAGETLVDQCTNDWEAEVDAEGHVFVHDVDFDFPGVGACGTWNDCDDAGWEGQLEETEAPGFVLDLAFCLENVLPGGLDLNATVECDIDGDGDEMHCAHQAVSNQSPPPAVLGGTRFELEGEVPIVSDPIALEHGE